MAGSAAGRAPGDARHAPSDQIARVEVREHIDVATHAMLEARLRQPAGSSPAGASATATADRALVERPGAALEESRASRAAREREEVLRRAVAARAVTITIRDSTADARSAAESSNVRPTAVAGREQGVVHRRRAGARPLFSVDGTEVPADVATSLDRERIVSVDVLKGAAAMRAYGAAGANGVVRITTRR